MAAYCRMDDLLSPAGWLPVHRDQLRAQRSVSSMGKPLYCIQNVHIVAKKIIPNENMNILETAVGIII